MNLELVKRIVSHNEFLVSDHADKEAAEEISTSSIFGAPFLRENAWRNMKIRDAAKVV